MTLTDTESAVRDELFSAQSLHGSACFSEVNEVKHAGLVNQQGIYHGLFSQRGPAIRLALPENTLLMGTVGGGKKQDTLFEQALTYPLPLYVADPSNRVGPVAIANQANLGKRGFVYQDKRSRLAGPPWFLPSHKVNPLSVLRPNHPQLAHYIEDIVRAIIEQGNDNRSPQYKEDIILARQWLEILIHWRIQSRNQVTSLPDIFDLINYIATRSKRWGEILKNQFRRSGIASYQRLANEMTLIHHRQPDRYLRIISIIQTAFECMNEPEARELLAENGLRVDQILASNMSFFNLSQHRMLQRVMPIAFMLGRQDIEGQEPLLFLLDERANLGRLERDEGGYIRSQKEFLVVEEVWECFSQLKTVLGDTAMNLKLARFPIQQFYSVSAYTAAILSKKLGSTTVRYKGSRTKMQDDQFNASIALAVLNGQDPLEEVVRANAQKETCDYQARLLRKPDELENMSNDRQIILCKNRCNPIYAMRSSYQSKSYLVGRYLPDPKHDQPNQIRVREANKPIKYYPIKIMTVPEQWRNLPQYESGYYAKVELPQGFKQKPLGALRSIVKKLPFL